MRIKQGKLSKWDTKLNQTVQISTFPYIFARATTGRVKGAVKPTPKARKGYTARTSKAVEKKTPVLTQITAMLSILVAMLISLPIRVSIMLGKSLGRVRTGLINSYWRVISMSKKTGPSKKSTGKPSSKQISVWDRLFAYVSLVIFAGLSIKPNVISDPLSRVAIVLLASHSIIRRFR